MRHKLVSRDLGKALNHMVGVPKAKERQARAVESDEHLKAAYTVCVWWGG